VTPRLAGLLSLKGDGTIALRGGVGLFYERTPSAAGAFEGSETRTVTRLASDGVTRLGPPLTYWPRTDASLQTARSRVWNAEYVHHLTRRMTLRLNVLDRQGTHALVETPGADLDDGHAVLRLSSSGRSSYREAGIGFDYVSESGREVSASYLRSASSANLNAFSALSGLLAVPFVRPDEYAPMNSDAPHRLVARTVATFGGKTRILGTLELRSGFPYSVVDERQDFVGPRNQGRHFPVAARVDLAIERRFTLWGWHPWIGIRLWNAFHSFLPLDVQNNLASPAFGSFYNSAPRLIRVTFRLER
jgi:hypothetical protein